jgi:hypothetical protein
MSQLSYASHLSRSVLWFAFSYIPLGVGVTAVAFPEFLEAHSDGLVSGLPRLDPTTKAAALLATVLVYFLSPFVKNLFLVNNVHFELHGYQADYLKTMATARGLGSDAAALQSIVDKAMTEESVKKAIFDTFHCVHCGSVNPAAWISERKGTKLAYPLAVSGEAVAFLSSELLLPVGPPGPGKKVQPGPRRSDPHKAARSCIDWAIKEFGPDGKSK